MGSFLEGLYEFEYRINIRIEKASKVMLNVAGYVAVASSSGGLSIRKVVRIFRPGR